MPILDQNSLEFISRGTEYTRRVGIRLGTILKSGDVICLVGDLGSGKTTLVQGMAAGWGSLDRVTSPTFVLVNLYRRLDGGQFHHLDAYRLKDAKEAEELDLEADIDSGPLVVEWAERISAALPKDHLWVSLRIVDENQRDLIFSARGDYYKSLLDKFRMRIYGGL
ncbi:MAG TPA: tRNA (adenosine(37)-N6)-threonylcarbamoyltransferase complex ATPase subunit type 1 TsaE [Anaerolineales bacterium]|jgi:tRNA threonylcarbamoyladenosine biosynthesis protein TsaE|nr:tRNA (adenosine(37)-N6)-threonylcarbamoyltransferase complex ATPase subunit type 1 TsaE [Anaerolineales bacterium]